jgi:hypothetical protein
VNGVDGPGAIRIEVEISPDARVAKTTICSTRPAGLGRLFCGRDADEAPALAGRLFTLCGFSQAAAARLAVTAAQGRAPSESDMFSLEIGIAAENISQWLRSTTLDWPRSGPIDDRRAAAAPLRDAWSAAQVIIGAATRGVAGAQRAELTPVAERLAQAAAALGLRADHPQTPSPDSLFAVVQSEAQSDVVLPSFAPDPLTPSDDGAVMLALKADRRFAAAPVLPGRCVETGAFARHWRETATLGCATTRRLAARFIALTEALASLRASLATGEPQSLAVAAAPLGACEGFGAVETARGRLYHWLRLDEAGRIRDYDVVAPTEWNFHPAGPLALALKGAEIGRGETARLRLLRIAAAFDPCVAFDVALRESGDA